MCHDTGMLLLMLVREFLAWTNMTYALKVCAFAAPSQALKGSTWPCYSFVQVYEAEANMGTEAAAREQLSQQLVSLWS